MAVSSSDGSIYIIGTGSYQLDYAPDIVTLAYDSEGNRLWEDIRFGPMSLAEAYGISIEVAPDGSMVYATGVGDAGFGTNTYFTVAFDTATGDSVWVKRYSTNFFPDHNRPSDIAVAPDGSKVYVTGYSYDWGTYGDYATIAYKSDNGHEIWVQRYDSPANGYDSAAAIAVAPDGSRVFVTGTSVYLNQEDFLTIAYSG
jgi:DNA-binding beta-propeller fold protein YncE